MSANDLDSGPGPGPAADDFGLKALRPGSTPYLAYALRGRTSPWRYLVGCLAALALAVLGVVALAVLQLLHLFPADFVNGLQDPGQPAKFYPATRRTVPAALISGVLFGAMHIPNGLPQAVSATVFGVVLAAIAIRTGGIAFTFGLHLANNLFGAVVVVSSGDAFRGSAGVVTQNTPQLMWWDAAAGVVGLLLVAALVYRGAARKPSP